MTQNEVCHGVGNGIGSEAYTDANTIGHCPMTLLIEIGVGGTGIGYTAIDPSSGHMAWLTVSTYCIPLFIGTMHFGKEGGGPASKAWPTSQTISDCVARFSNLCYKP